MPKPAPAAPRRGVGQWERGRGLAVAPLLPAQLLAQAPRAAAGEPAGVGRLLRLQQPASSAASHTQHANVAKGRQGVGDHHTPSTQDRSGHRATGRVLREPSTKEQAGAACSSLRTWSSACCSACCRDSALSCAGGCGCGTGAAAGAAGGAGPADTGGGWGRTWRVQCRLLIASPQ